MSRRNLGRLADSKGAELLALLKAELTPPKAKASPQPCEQNVHEQVTRARSARTPHLTPHAQRATRVLETKKAKKAKKNGITVIKVRNANERAIYRQALA